MQKLHFELAVVVWGHTYTDLFLEIVIPNYLSEYNLPACAKKYSLSLDIYTTSEDRNMMAAHPHFQKLQKQCPIQFFETVQHPQDKQLNKWGIKGYCQSMAIKKAILNQSILLLLNPDSLISNGGLLRCFELIAQGKKTILIAELVRTAIESVVPRLKASYYDPNTFALTVTQRQLVDIGIEHLHDIGKILFWKGINPKTSRVFSQWPSVLYWKAGQKSLLAKFFHLHPLALDLRKIEKSIPTVIAPDDGGLIESLGIPVRDIYVVTDSEEFACVELSSTTMDPLGSIPCYPLFKTLSLIKWAWRATLPSHRDQFLRYNIHYQGTEELEWHAIEKKMTRHLLIASVVFRVINYFSRERLKRWASYCGILQLRNRLKQLNESIPTS